MDVAELEPGEITDDSDCGIDLYTPLQRPVEAGPRPNTLQDDPVVDTDSDDDFPCGKRMRMTTGSCQIPKKYSVWTSNANDDISDILTSFGMDTPENDRNVENYPIPKEYIQKKKERELRKRKVPTGRKFSPLVPVPVSIDIEDIAVADTDTIEEVSKSIAEKLSEPNLELVLRIVLILGKTAAVEYFKKTREIESKGGLLIMNGSRRRTSGGVFIHLIRTDKKIPGSKLIEIFEDPRIVSVRKTEAKLRKRKKRYKIRKELSNPPPSPETSDLPPLPERCELIVYEGMDYPDFP